MRKKITMSNTIGIAAGAICLLLMLFILPTSIATASSSEVIIPPAKTRTVFTGHSFTTGEGVRVYLFDLYVDNSRVASAPRIFKTNISWNGTNHTLTVHNEINGDKLWGHQEIDVKYQCDYDPFLDPTTKCRYVSHTPYKEVTGDKNSMIYFNPIGIFNPTHDGSVYLSVYRGVISSAKIMQLTWEALSKSMKTSVFAAGTVASSNANQTFTTDTEIVFQVESARDIKRRSDQPVSFYIVPYHSNQVTDINRNIIAMPMEGKYSGNSYNETVRTLTLMPGKYTFYASMMSSLTSTVESKKIPFEVKSQIDPHKAPIIISPRNQQRFASQEAVPIAILVPVKFFENAFTAEVEAEHSRLATQTPYKPLMKHSLNSQYNNNSLVTEQRVFNKDGDYRIRARNVYDDEPTGTWSEWRYFHIGGKVMPHLNPGLVISSPVEKNYYTGDIPVTITLPQIKDGTSLQLVLSFQEDTVPNSDNQLQDQHVPFAIMSEEFSLIEGQSVVEKKYSRSKLITATKNKVGEFQLRAELSIPGAFISHTATRIFHLAQLGDSANDEQQKKSGKLNLLVNHGLVTHGISAKNQKVKMNLLTHAGLAGGKQAAGTKFAPPANLKEFKFTRPESGKVYRNKFLVDISVPSSLHDNPTITLELICRPLKKGLLKKRAYTPKTNLLTMPLYSRYKDRVLTTILARNIHSKVFHGINGFSSSEFKIRAIIHTGKTSLTQTSGWFRLLYDEREYRQENSALSLAPSVNLESKLQIFKSPTSVKIRVGHMWNAKITYQIQYNDCQFGKKFRTISLKPKITTKNETTKILNFHIKKAGCYRVRAQNRKTGTNATWSTWCNFTVQTSRHTVSNSHSINNLSASGKMVTTSPSSLNQKLGIKGLRTSYKIPARVEIKLTGVSHNPPFELRYHPSTGGRYVSIRKPAHSFNRSNNLTSLTLNVKKPGHYQLRFKNNDRKSWSPWKNFTITEGKIPGSGFKPDSIRPKAINPQPEPPGRPIPQQPKLR